MATSRAATRAVVQLELSYLPRLLNLAPPAGCSGVRGHSGVVQSVAPADGLSRKLEPYRKVKRPQSWPQIRLRLAENAARHRPTTKNRMHWDRQMQKQLQIAVRPESLQHVRACNASLEVCSFVVCRRRRGHGRRTHGETSRRSVQRLRRGGSLESA